MTSAYKHIIWDWNGTLLNDAWLCIEVLNSILDKRQRAPISEAIYREHFGFPVINFYQYLGFDFEDDSFDIVSREFIDGYEARWLEECILHPETDRMLHTLSQSGVTHSVLSAAEQSALEVGIRHYQLDTHFKSLVGADNIYAKGKVERGRELIENLKPPLSDTVLIGDTLHDYEVAQAIGTDCILLAHGHHSANRLARTGAPVVQNHQELLAQLTQRSNVTAK
jgi:phosphoglycolate phosphatase